MNLFRTVLAIVAFVVLLFLLGSLITNSKAGELVIENVDTGRMTRETGLALETIREAFDSISMTSKEASAAWIIASLDKVGAAYELWEQLSKKEIASAISSKEIIVAIRYAPSHLADAAHKKWFQLSLGEIVSATTAQEAKTAYEDAPTQPPYDNERLAFLKWENLSEQEIQRAETFQETYDAYYKLSPRTHKLETLALPKMLELADKYTEAFEIFKKTSRGSSERGAAVRRMVALAANFTEAEDALSWTLSQGLDHEAERRMAIRKLATFFPKQ